MAPAAKDGWRDPGEGGWWPLWCENGHVWEALAVLRGESSPGEVRPADCPECGLPGEIVD